MHSRYTISAVFLALALLYALALSMSMFNEFFDGSKPQFEQATVIAKSTRLNPMPVAVLSLKPQSGNSYNIDVLDELSEKTNTGDVIQVARSRGFLGKPWFQDKDFYLYLGGTRTIQGFLYLGMALFLSVLWYANTKRAFANRKLAVLSLFPAYAISYGIFWILP